MILRSERLLLIAATVEMVRAEIHDRRELARLVEARVPADWPPPLNDETSQQWTLTYLLSNPDAAGFGYWYIALPDQTAEGKSLVGIVGLKGKPTIDGTVEVGYSVMEDRQRQGYGSEATSALIAWVFDHPEVTRVVAETLPHLRPSIRVMERNGMSFLGSGSEEGVIRFGITRAEFEAARPKQQ
ncbi:MAG: GNAT family N-acetyltransferase [Acidobacteria bacterium]|nr:GNAT family N-acetyltransferase [Acidobacteriota bacterium]